MAWHDARPLVWWRELTQPSCYSRPVANELIAIRLQLDGVSGKKKIKDAVWLHGLSADCDFVCCGLNFALDG